MVTITGTPVPFRLPTRRDLGDLMMKDRAVMIVAIICAAIVVSLFIGAIVFLVAGGHSAEALTGGAVIGIITAIFNISSRMKAVEKAVDANPSLPAVTKD